MRLHRVTSRASASMQIRWNMCFPRSSRRGGYRSSPESFSAALSGTPRSGTDAGGESIPSRTAQRTAATRSGSRARRSASRSAAPAGSRTSRARPARPPAHGRGEQRFTAAIAKDGDALRPSPDHLRAASDGSGGELQAGRADPTGGGPRAPARQPKKGRLGPQSHATASRPSRPGHGGGAMGSAPHPASSRPSRGARRNPARRGRRREASAAPRRPRPRRSPTSDRASRPRRALPPPRPAPNWRACPRAHFSNFGPRGFGVPRRVSIWIRTSRWTAPW